MLIVTVTGVETPPSASTARYWNVRATVPPPIVRQNVPSPFQVISLRVNDVETRVARIGVGPSGSVSLPSTPYPSMQRTVLLFAWIALLAATGLALGFTRIVI